MLASVCPRVRGSLIQGWHSLIPRSYSHSPRNAPLRPRYTTDIRLSLTLHPRLPTYATIPHRSLPYSLMKKKVVFHSTWGTEPPDALMFPCTPPLTPLVLTCPVLLNAPCLRNVRGAPIHTRCAPVWSTALCACPHIGSFFRSLAQVRRSYPAICLVDRRDRWRHCRCQQPPSCRRRAACSTPKRVSSHF